VITTTPWNRLMWERALTVMYPFKKCWIVPSFSRILPVVCFFKEKIEI
jgi:hypothetical protein